MDRCESRMPISLLLLLVDTLQTTLENRVASFEEWLKLWTAIVVLGLLYEYGCELLEPPRNWPPKRSWPFRHSFQLAKLGAIFVTVGVAGELYVEVMLSPAQEALRKFNDTRLAELNKEAGDARKEAGLAIERASKADERASKNEREAVALWKVAEDERIARVEIEQRVAWRRLTTTQQAEIGLHLSKLPPQIVSVWYAGPDLECQTFAGDLARALRATDAWVVSSPGTLIQYAEGGSFKGPIPTLVSGITVVGTAEAPTRAAGDAIVQEILRLGFDAVMSPKIERGKFAQIWVNVEHRPEGPQGEAKLRTSRPKKEQSKPVTPPIRVANSARNVKYVTAKT
jgi:hypothetical protein